MCGIVGLLYRDGRPVDTALISRMTARLKHRGPDSQDTLCKENLGLGHARLAIIDPEHGAQPMRSADGQHVLVFNGEIYNYRELRTELQQKGVACDTNSDTEVLLIAYATWGIDCLKKLRGMFAFAIADFHQQTLYLARDPLGIKPLYALNSSNQFAFASELQALYGLPGWQDQIDPVAIDTYLQLGYIPAPMTPYPSIRKVEPGTYWRISLKDGGEPLKQRYWSLPIEPREGTHRNEALEALDEVLKDSVAKHLVADVPFGAFLSGGIDSSLVVRYMAELLDEPVHTYTIGFAGTSDERPFAAEVARTFATAHTEKVIDASGFDLLSTLVRHYGEPYGDSSAIPTYHVSALAAQDVKMVLSGDGGDEGFAGYRTYAELMSWLEFRDLPPRFKPLAHWWARFSGVHWLRRANLPMWLRQVQICDDTMRASLWRRQWGAVCGAFSKQRVADFDRMANRQGPVEAAQHWDLRYYLPDDILTKVDRAAMLHGLEVRTPLTDINVITTALQYPTDWNMYRNQFDSWQGKQMLIDLLAPQLRPGFCKRPKRGFSIPLAKWLKPDGRYLATLRKRLLSEASPLLQWFEPQAIKSLFDQHQDYPIWLMLVLDEWLQQQAAGHAY